MLISFGVRGDYRVDLCGLADAIGAGDIDHQRARYRLSRALPDDPGKYPAADVCCREIIRRGRRCLAVFLSQG